MTLPNFLIIGAPRSATTTLHFSLIQHPEIFMCPVKEPGFFLACGQQFDFRGPGKERLRNSLITDVNDYMNLFRNVKDQKAIGESSVGYLADPLAPKNIYRFIPNVKLMVSLRQPADRAFSAFCYNIREGLEPSLNFSEAISEERSGKRDGWYFCRYLNRGLYFTFLMRYLEYFDRSQLLVTLLDDLVQDSDGFMRKIFHFLDVDESFGSVISHKHNVSGIISNPILRVVWKRSYALRSMVRPFISERKRHFASEIVHRDMKKPTFSPELREELTEFYRQEIERLQDFLQRDLSHWLYFCT